VDLTVPSLEIRFVYVVVNVSYVKILTCKLYQTQCGEEWYFLTLHGCTNLDFVYLLLV